ncbi:hypothetical protein TI04_12935, partial [Achromatium sp. WMS2]
FRFLQMPLFTKQEHELTSHFDKWIYFLKNLEDLDSIPAILNEPVFNKAFRAAEIANLSYQQHTTYEQNLLDYMGLKAAMANAKDEGRKIGLIEGEAIGEVKGQAALLKRLLTKKFGPLSPASICKLDTATVEQLETWSEAILDCDSIEQLLR